MAANRSRTTRSPGDGAGQRRLRLPAAWLAGGLALVVLSAFGGLLQSQGLVPIGEASAAEQTALASRGSEMLIPLEERPVAPPIRIPTASYGDGSVFDLGEEQGKVVALYFMAAWCLTCYPEAQAMAQLHERYADQGLRILVLDVDQTETEEHLARFREITGGGEHLWGLDPGNQVARSYGVRALDTTIFIDRDGRIAYGDAYPTDYEDLAAVTEALLQ